MAKWFLSLLCFFFLFSCGNKGAGEAALDSVETENDTPALTEELPVDKSRQYIWEVDPHTKTKTRNPALQDHFYDVDVLVDGLNEKYPRVKLEKKTLSHDTLYTEIKDAQYLTEQMGSAGAEQYIAQVVLNLTSVNGVNCVRIDFAEGSHASPDVWCREMFGDYKEQN